MAREFHRQEALPLLSASVINERAVVRLAASGNDFRALPAATVNVEPFGVALATAASQGVAVAVLDHGNVVKVIAGGSIGGNADVGIGSDNGALFPVAGAAGSVVWSVGKALSPAAAGEYFSLYIRPRQLSGTP